MRVAFFFSSRRRHTRCSRDWSSDVCSSDLSEGENYARELLELFTFGVDNGYDQNDITVMSRAWTGWSVNIMDRTNEFNRSEERRVGKEGRSRWSPYH